MNISYESYDISEALFCLLLMAMLLNTHVQIQVVCPLLTYDTASKRPESFSLILIRISRNSWINSWIFGLSLPLPLFLIKEQNVRFWNSSVEQNCTVCLIYHHRYRYSHLYFSVTIIWLWDRHFLCLGRCMYCHVEFVPTYLWEVWQYVQNSWS